MDKPGRALQPQPEPASNQPEPANNQPVPHPQPQAIGTHLSTYPAYGSQEVSSSSQTVSTARETTNLYQYVAPPVPPHAQLTTYNLGPQAVNLIPHGSIYYTPQVPQHVQPYATFPPVAQGPSTTTAPAMSNLPAGSTGSMNFGGIHWTPPVSFHNFGPIYTTHSGPPVAHGPRRSQETVHSTATGEGQHHGAVALREVRRAELARKKMEGQQVLWDVYTWEADDIQLEILSQPSEACVVPAKRVGKVKRPIDPQPVIEAHWARNGKANGFEETFLQSPYLQIICVPVDKDMKALPIPADRVIMGCTTSTVHLLRPRKTEQGRPGRRRYLFKWDDLSFKVTGEFRLKFSLFTVDKNVNHEPSGPGPVRYLKSIFSLPFKVVPANNFRGMSATVPLAAEMHDSGIKMRVRRRATGKRKNSADDGDEIDLGDELKSSASGPAEPLQKRSRTASSRDSTRTKVSKKTPARNATEKEADLGIQADLQATQKESQETQLPGTSADMSGQADLSELGISPLELQSATAVQPQNLLETFDFDNFNEDLGMFGQQFDNNTGFGLGANFLTGNDIFDATFEPTSLPPIPFLSSPDPVLPTLAETSAEDSLNSSNPAGFDIFNDDTANVNNRFDFQTLFNTNRRANDLGNGEKRAGQSENDMPIEDHSSFMGYGETALGQQVFGDESADGITMQETSDYRPKSYIEDVYSAFTVENSDH